jgi:O-antigen ligase
LVLHFAQLHIWTPNPAVANRLNITFADPNITARFLTLCACAAVLIFAARKAPAWLALATAAACGLALPMTFSRSGLLLFIAGLVVAFVLALDHRRAAAIGALALIAFGMSTLTMPENRDRAAATVATVVDVFTHSAHKANSAATTDSQGGLIDNRTYLVAAGLRMFRDHPIKGVGFGGYQHALLTTYRSYLPPKFTDSVSHTSFVTVMAEQGAIGALLFLAFLVLLGRESVRAARRRDEWSVWIVLPATTIVMIFLYSQFEARFFTEPYLWISLALLYSGLHLAGHGRAAESSRYAANDALTKERLSDRDGGGGRVGQDRAPTGGTVLR